MTLVSDIIVQAFRENNILPLGKTPTDAQNTEALILYNANLNSFYGTDVGEHLQDWPLGDFGLDPENPLTSYYPLFDYRCVQGPRINSRLIATNPQAMSVDFPSRAQDGARMAIIDPYGRLASAPVTLNGNGRTIEGAPTQLINTDSQRTVWMYRADRGDWMKISQLTLADENPFPLEFDQLIWCRLALRLNPRFGRAMDDQTREVLSVLSRDFKARYINSQPLERDQDIAWPFMSRQGYDTERAFTSTPAFNRGDPFSG